MTEQQRRRTYNREAYLKRTEGKTRRNRSSNFNDPKEGCINEVFDSYRKRAAEKNIEFQLDINSVRTLIESSCHYCTKNYSSTKFRKGGKFQFRHNGIDRKDNSLGYTKENCVTCCQQCNYAKNDYTYEEFREWVQRVSKHLLSA